MTSRTYEVKLRVDGAEHDVTIVAHSAESPPLTAPGGSGTASLGQMGCLCVAFPEDYSGPREAHADTEHEISLVHGETETPCVFLMKTIGHPDYEAYLWLEPDAYSEWNFSITS